MNCTQVGCHADATETVTVLVNAWPTPDDGKLVSLKFCDDCASDFREETVLAANEVELVGSRPIDEVQVDLVDDVQHYYRTEDGGGDFYLNERYRPYGGVHTDAVVCTECSTESTVSLYVNEIPEHEADAHTADHVHTGSDCPCN